MRKKFDSVELQRTIRAKLSKRYGQSPKIEIKELELKFHHLKNKNLVYTQQRAEQY